MFKLKGAGLDPLGIAKPTRSTETSRSSTSYFYLDAADRSASLWALPGSHRWAADDARAAVERLSAGSFSTDGAVPLVMEPGDALLHDVVLAHGSPPTTSRERRVLYYEFRPAEVELAYRPHVPQ